MKPPRPKRAVTSVTDTVVVAPDGAVCEEPTPPEGVPTAAEAEQRARDLVAATGADPAAYQFETYADEWYAGVSAVRRVEGMFDAGRFDFGFGAEGVMQYASGQLAEPQRVGPYPLIGLDAAIARLNDQASMWGGGYASGEVAVMDGAVGIAESAVADSAGEGTDAQPPETTAAGDETVATVPYDQMPVDELPQPEAVTITLVNVEADVWWAWDADGSVWLLPAYRFIDTDGGWHVVPAVTDEFMIQVEPSVVDGPLPAPEPLPVDPPVAARRLPTACPPASPIVFDRRGRRGRPRRAVLPGLHERAGHDRRHTCTRSPTSADEALGATVRPPIEQAHGVAGSTARRRLRTLVV